VWHWAKRLAQFSAQPATMACSKWLGAANATSYVSRGCLRTSSSATASRAISVLVFGMATPVLLVEEWRSGFSGIFEIVAAGKPGVVG
jgi:hypothetical protein